MANTPKLTMPYIATGQAQKELTHNDALNDLDTLVQLRVLDRDLTAPPGSPSDGDCYIVAASATGAWSGQSTKLALYYGGWRFKTPLSGWRAYVVDEAIYVDYSGTSWNTSSGGGGGGGGLASLGTVSAPGISFTSDSDTGFYSDGSNSLRMVTNGTERMRISGGGIMSVGTSNAPAYSGQNLISGASNNVPYLQVGENMRSLYIGSSYDASFLGTSYVGFNVARTASNVWTLYGDGTRNGGSLIEASPYGLFRYYAMPSTGTGNATMTDTAILAALRLMVSDSNVALAGDNGLESLRAARATNQVNRIEITGAATGSPASIAAAGSDTNLDLALITKGSGRLNITISTANTVTTVGAAGGASALPATPVGYLRTTINGTIRKIPYYID